MGGGREQYCNFFMGPPGRQHMNRLDGNDGGGREHIREDVTGRGGSRCNAVASLVSFRKSQKAGVC